MSPEPSQRVATLKRTLIRQIFESAPRDALNLGLGQPDLSAPEIVREALAREARRGPSGYGPTAGDLELRQRIAATYPGFVSGADDVLVACGGQQAMFAALGALLDAGDEILVPDPGFPGARRAAESWGAHAVPYPLRAERGFHLDPDEVLARVNKRTRALVVVTPSNPTGTAEPASSLARLADGVRSRRLALVIDDIYRELYWVGRGRAPGPPAEPRTEIVVVGGLSKAAAMTGWRVGWVACPDRHFMARVVALQQTLLTCAPTPIQRACKVLFTKAGQRAIGELRERFRQRRDTVQQILGARSGLSMAPLEGAFYAWIDASRAGGGMALAERLLREDKLVVIPGVAFGAGADDWIRVSYAQDDVLLRPALLTIAARLEESLEEGHAN